MRCRARSQLVQPGFGPATRLSSIFDLRSFIFSVLSSRLLQSAYDETHPRDTPSVCSHFGSIMRCCRGLWFLACFLTTASGHGTDVER